MLAVAASGRRFIDSYRQQVSRAFGCLTRSYWQLAICSNLLLLNCYSVAGQVARHLHLLDTNMTSTVNCFRLVNSDWFSILTEGFLSTFVLFGSYCCKWVGTLTGLSSVRWLGIANIYSLEQKNFVFKFMVHKKTINILSYFSVVGTADTIIWIVTGH
jgi:hypothetical protein